jgi:FdhD protein
MDQPAAAGVTTPFEQVQVVRVRGARRERAVDCAAAEEPLEVRLHGQPFAVIMRTPGADLELTAGFLLAERVIGGADDLGTIQHCSQPDAEPLQTWDEARQESRGSNVVNVTLATEVGRARLERMMADRRNVVTNSSCGLCGRTTIASLRTAIAPLQTDAVVLPAALADCADRLRSVQPVFAVTGGLHAAALFRADRSVEATAEDVGRHNAVDKVIGRLLMRDALPLSGRILFVSGRASFEIVQKAWLAGVPIVASVSAPSSLAIALAHEAGLTLVGFVRDGGFNIYTHAQRIA